MTEKRFKYVEFTKNVLSFDDNGVCRFFNEQDFEDWLNELAEENQQLKKELEDCRNIKLFSRRELERENKELKEEIQLFKDGMEAYENAIPYVCTCEQVSDIHSEMFDLKGNRVNFIRNIQVDVL